MSEPRMEWIPAPLLVNGQPRAWGTGVYPWTFVITFNGEHYAASANDSRSPLPARVDLGDDFTTLGAAQDACRAFLHSRGHRLQ